MGDNVVYISTTAGVYALDVAERQVLDTPQLATLRSTLVSQVAVRDETLLAAVPELHQVHDMMSWKNSVNSSQAACKPGLYVVNLHSREPAAAAAAVWHGNAKSCAVEKAADGSLTYYVGTEPADVLISSDKGGTWLGTDSFKAIPGRRCACEKRS